jgi:AcrR family transcriptional regulator
MRSGREAIVKAAVRIFAENGFAGASTREICRAAGVTRPVLYYHFRGKEHLYQELMIDCFGNYQKLMLGALQARGTLRERLVRMIYADFSLTKDDPVRTKFVLRMIFSPGAQHPLFDYIAEMEKERRWIASVLQEGIDGRALRGNARELATNLMGMQVIATLEYLLTGRPTLTRRRAAQCVDVLLQGCAARQDLFTDRYRKRMNV